MSECVSWRVMADSTVFTTLRWPRQAQVRRVWAVSAIHGEAERLKVLHDAIAPRLRLGDRLVYLGNYLGRGPAVRAALDELIAFRRRVIALPGMFASDVVYLRGCQEEMWHKTLQLQFATNPGEVLTWTLGQGLAATLAAYGGAPDEGMSVMRQGAVAIGKWTQKLRQTMNQTPGHADFMAALKRAAFTDDHGLLFVSAGIDPALPLPAQGDALWWGGPGFVQLEAPGATPYEGYARVVRGAKPTGAPAQAGVAQGSHTATVDGGAGFGGQLLAACFDGTGAAVDMVTA
jgi:serine/threonine protein phosphatase 1